MERSTAFREALSEEHYAPGDARAGFRATTYSATGPEPWSTQEADALRAIDEARAAEINPPTRRQLRRRARKHWSDRDHALGH